MSRYFLNIHLLDLILLLFPSMELLADSEFSTDEEMAHTLTHGVGILLSIAGAVALMITAVSAGTVRHVVSAGIFGATLILMYAASTLYHALPPGRFKKIFKTMDHFAIYLLIAGSYTPFALVNLRDNGGRLLFGAIWILAFLGIVFSATHRGRSILRHPWCFRHPMARICNFSIVQTLLYLVMGWLIVIVTKPLFASVPAGGLTLLFLGGLSYSLGVIFYLRERMPYHQRDLARFCSGGECHALFFCLLLCGAVQIMTAARFIRNGGVEMPPDFASRWKMMCPNFQIPCGPRTPPGAAYFSSLKVDAPILPSGRPAPSIWRKMARI